MSLKNNYLELTKNIGGPYALIKKGIKRTIICSLLEGKDVRISNVVQVAKALGVSVETLIADEQVLVCEPAQVYGFFNKHEPLDEDEKRYLDMLMYVLRGKNKKNVSAIKENIEAFYESKDMEKGCCPASADIKKQQAC